MKSKKLLGILMTVMLLLAACFTVALADPISVSMELSTSKFTEPKEVTVTINVSSTGESDMPGPISLYWPNGKKVRDFGDPVLTVGGSKSWTGKWKVTQKQLENGKITFAIKYPVANDDGTTTDQPPKYYSKRITYTPEVAAAKVEVNRTISPTTAAKGQEVTVTYDVVNAGTVDISSVMIRENKSISSSPRSVKTVKAGEKATLTFKVKMGSKNLTSEPSISYKVGGQTQKLTKEAATIKYGEVNVTASLSADKKGGTVGDPLTLTLKLTNKSKKAINHVTASDATVGDFLTDGSLDANKTVKLTKSVSIDQSRDYQVKVSIANDDGSTTEVSTDRVTITAIDPAQKISLDVKASADRDAVTEIPGTVVFRVSVTNNGAADVSDVNVYAVNTQLYHFPTIKAGETRSFTRDVSISMPGTFGFNARVKNQLKEISRFDSNSIYIAQMAPTPAPTEVPVETVNPPVYEEIPTEADVPASLITFQSVTHVLTLLFGLLGAAALVLFGIGLVRRYLQKKASEASMGSLNDHHYRDYSQPAAEPEEAAFETVEQPEEAAPAEDPDAVGTDVMQETLDRIYQNAKKADADVTVHAVDDTDPIDLDAADTDAPRRRRRNPNE